MGKRHLDSGDETTVIKKVKKVKSSSKDKKLKKSSNKKEKKNENNENIVVEETANDKCDLAIHDLLSIEHSISLIQENLAKIVNLAPTSNQLSNYIKNLVSSSTENNGDVTAKILLLSKSQKVQLAAQLKSLYDNDKLKIFDQIVNFSGNTQLDSADDIQLLLKEKKQKEINDRSDNTTVRLLPPLPIIYDSILEAKVFVHKSATNCDLHTSKQEEVQSNNERLEYLGDAILEAVMSDILEERYSDFDEGQLSLLRSIMVKNETIEIISRSYKFPQRQQDLLNSHVIKTDLAIDSHIGTNKRIADLFEAFIGALFIDKGRNGIAYDEIKIWLLQVYDPIFKEYDSSDNLKYTHLSDKLVKKLLENKVQQIGKKTIFDSYDDNKPSISDKKEVQMEDTSNEKKFPITFTSSEAIDKLAKGDLYALVGSAKLHPVYKQIQAPTNTGHPSIVQCIIGNDILGIGEGRNIKDASARAAKAALLNRPIVEKYHLIRMMTPREESRIASNQESNNTKSKNNQKFETKPTILKLPYIISQSEIQVPNSAAKADLVDLLSLKNCIPEIISERDVSTNSILPLFKTTLKINGKTISSCIDPSKKKGANKVSQWLLNEIKDHGNDTIFKEIGL